MIGYTADASKEPERSAPYLCFLALSVDASLPSNRSFHHRLDLFSLCGPCGVRAPIPNTLWLRYCDLVTESGGGQGGVNGVA